MGHPTQPSPEFSYYADEEIDLLDLIKVLWRSRRLIAAVTLFAVLAGLLFGLTRERTYESVAVFVLERPASVTQNVTTSTAALVSVLRSRMLAEAVVDELQLPSRWDGVSRSQAVRRLQENVTIDVNDRDGIVTVKFKDPNPALARDVVQTYITQFEAVARQLVADEAQRATAAAEQRLSAVAADLRAAEAALQSFKEQYGIVDLVQQTALLVEAHAAVVDQIRALSAELSGKQAYLPADHPEVQELVARIAALERQRQALEEGAADGSQGSKFGLNDAPMLALELERLEREVRVQRELYQSLRQQYEAARLEAEATITVARLIDPPQVPEEPASRRLLLHVAMAGFLGVFVGVMAAFVIEFLRQRAQDEEAVRELPFLSRFRERTS